MSIDKAREVIFSHDPWGRAYLNEAALVERIREVAREEFARLSPALVGGETVDAITAKPEPGTLAARIERDKRAEAFRKSTAHGPAPAPVGGQTEKRQHISGVRLPDGTAAFPTPPPAEPGGGDARHLFEQPGDKNYAALVAVAGANLDAELIAELRATLAERDRRIAALEAGPAVKPLRWRYFDVKTEHGTGAWDANTSWSGYSIEVCDGQDFPYYCPKISDQFKTLEEAQAAVQRDHEDRVRRALLSPATDKGGE